MTLPPLQDFFSRETDFHFCQFLSNFLRYSFSNSPSSHLYNIFAIYFSSNSLLLKSFFSIISSFSYFLTSTFILLSNSSIASLVFPRFSSFSHMSYSAVNLFHLIKYFSVSLIFLLFKIFSTSYSLTPSTSIGLPSSFFYSSTCFLYCIIQLIFTTRWILIEVGSYNLTVLVDITSSIVYGPTYWSTNFLTGLSLNIKSFVLNITLSSFFYFSVSFLSISTCLFISPCVFFKATPASSYTFFIFSTNSIALSIFPFFLISPPILNSLS